MTASVLQVLDRKGHHVTTVREDMNVADVARLLSDRRIGGVPVLDAAGVLVGLVSERALVGALSRYGADFARLRAEDVMMRNVPTTSLDEDIVAVARRMTGRRARHVPVLENGAVVGLVSIGDLVKFRIEEARHAATSGRNYIIGNTDHAA
ncbi:putative transcriptional regulator, XRE family [Gluconacetobacter diazotrophicus PA1 5]|nr:CBS domain-containing protein [Gluconacetobacter diazotrophicus]ACI50495.1 putative transcriptional regulator, XRE family [Gluconacetobacter diazotrophicus PA1 5]TWB02774.1 CBS domain protein [Gluconacetobacter diazotrophicus]